MKKLSSLLLVLIIVSVLLASVSCTQSNKNKGAAIVPTAKSSYVISYPLRYLSDYDTLILDPQKNLYVANRPFEKNGKTEASEVAYKLISNVKSFDFLTIIQEDGNVWNIQSGFEKLKKVASKATWASTGIVPLILKTDGSLWWDGHKKLDEVTSILDESDYVSDYALKKDGSLWSFLGDTPKKILEGVESFKVKTRSDEAPDEIVYAMLKDQSLWAFGTNSLGGLGNGTLDESKVPIKITDGLDTLVLSNGTVYALKNDRTLWSWGNNSFGQVGDGTRVNKLTSVNVLSDVVKVGAFKDTAYAIKEDNTLWIWGKGRNAGNNVNPYKISDDVKEVIVDRSFGSYADGNKAFFLKHDGTLFEVAIDKTKETLLIAEDIALKILENVKSFSYSEFSYNAIMEDSSLWMWSEIPNFVCKSTTPLKVAEDALSIIDNEVITYFTKNDGTLWVIGHTSDIKIFFDNGLKGEFDLTPKKVEFK